MTNFKIGDVVRLKSDNDEKPNSVVRSIYLDSEKVSSEAFCVSECGKRIFWALSSNLELVNRPDPQADLKQAIREVLLSEEFMAAFAAAFMVAPFPFEIPCDPKIEVTDDPT